MSHFNNAWYNDDRKYTMKKKSWIILGSIIGFLGLIISLYFLEESYTDIILHGNKIVNTRVLEEYHDAGFDLFHNNKLLNKEKYQTKVESNVNTSILGKYRITYDVKYHLRHFHLERIVNVIDDVKPEITTNIDTIERDYCTKKDKVGLTVSAHDNYDGDLTDKIEKNEGEDAILFKVSDTSGNSTSKMVTIKYATKPSPVFKLNGNSTVYVSLGGKYTEKGAGYYDGCGKKIDEKITITGTVDTEKEGTYKIIYTLANGKQITRKVIVSKPSSGKGKVIYLTFDDGPGPYTKKILSILAKYNVKATFFVTNQFPGYVNLIKNEYQEGHTVAVHTYTHNYNVYKSVDAYINDFNKMNNVIEKYTGSKSKIFRFPGGSSNTVSRNYAKGVVRAIANKMTSLGYKYFDWDVSSGDASGANSTKIYNNVVNGVKSCSKCIVLMHDIKSTTTNALDNILKTLTERGYKFDKLTINSPTVHHSIAN